MMATPDLQTLRAAVALAARAPSIHNSQPWRWLHGTTSLHLYADAARLLPATDPDGRDLMLSCGAALHHLQVTMAASGWATHVHRLPNPNQPDHLAAVDFRPREPSRDDIALAAAIQRRRTDRRRYTSWPVPAELLADLARTAGTFGAVLMPTTEPDDRYQLVRALAEASTRQEADLAYAAELAAWAGRSPFVAEGVPATNIPAGERRHGDTTMRAFPNGQLTDPGDRWEDDAGELLVLATATDTTESRLRAGEPMSSVLLWATDFRMATCPLSQVLEVEATRDLVRDRVLDGFGVPQIVLRVGWAPVNTAPLPATPRRPIDDIFGRQGQ
ncbi:Acg family FMN-binding oxidoreductase [Kutzneria sp. CA-103260]|uniref:Acg family FMN-binding oxidoreductase n=1 Tax=Kutzneria sp. CA-103260 TaxID=2802641 RepID=UPI001BAC6882|nr:nitroreductase family protein [Kutzneria sp. CA-103260]QUQ64064.1 nitroreductase [Kutzneria sp. CA-103260]